MPRTLPVLTAEDREFWTGGADGVLRVSRCGHCRYWIQPATGFCPACEKRSTAFEPVSGRGTVASFTINYQPWFPDMTVPYVIAIVELEEQEGLRLMTNIVDCAPEDVAIGVTVEVCFEDTGVDDIHLPLFRLVDSR